MSIPGFFEIMKSGEMVVWFTQLCSEETSCSAGFAAGVCKASLWWATGRLDLDYRSPGGHGSTVKNVKRQQKWVQDVQGSAPQLQVNLWTTTPLIIDIYHKPNSCAQGMVPEGEYQSREGREATIHEGWRGEPQKML